MNVISVEQHALDLLARLRGGWRLAAVSFVAVLAGCSGGIVPGMTEPEDVAVAEELCAKRGGFAHVSRYEGGAKLLIFCKDSAYIEMRLPKKSGAAAKGPKLPKEGNAVQAGG